VSILDSVNSPQDLKGLSEAELIQLAGDIRKFFGGERVQDRRTFGAKPRSSGADHRFAPGL